MSEPSEFETVRRIVAQAISTAYSSHPIGSRQFSLEACAYATERADAYSQAQAHGPEGEMTLAYVAVARYYGRIAAAQTRQRLDAALEAK